MSIFSNWRRISFNRIGRYTQRNCDIVLRLRHRQPFAALGPPSSWPDRPRVGKKRQKCEASVENRCFNGSLGISPSSHLSSNLCSLRFAGSKVEKICGSAES